MNDVEKMEAMDKMDAKEFAEALWNNAVHSDGEWPPIIARRDAYRERQALESAWKRYEAWLRDPSNVGVRAAILGTQAFEVGQLVRRKDSKTFFEWPGDTKGVHQPPDYYEPVIDRDGDPIYLPVEEA